MQKWVETVEGKTEKTRAQERPKNPPKPFFFFLKPNLSDIRSIANQKKGEGFSKQKRDGGRGHT